VVHTRTCRRLIDGACKRAAILIKKSGHALAIWIYRLRLVYAVMVQTFFAGGAIVEIVDWLQKLGVS
jgi:hypothetical protein